MRAPLCIAAAVVVSAFSLYRLVKYERELSDNKKDDAIRRDVRNAIKNNDAYAVLELIRKFSDVGLVDFFKFYKDNYATRDYGFWPVAFSMMEEELAYRGI